MEQDSSDSGKNALIDILPNFEVRGSRGRRTHQEKFVDVAIALIVFCVVLIGLVVSPWLTFGAFFAWALYGFLK